MRAQGRADGLQGQTLFHDTIFALSSGGLPAGVAVVRLSGPQARDALRGLIGSLPPPRAMRFARLCDQAREPIDTGLAVFFPGPASFTGEDCVELQIHGGRAGVGKLLAVLSAMPGLRQAEAGEFTRRALAHGKIDLPGAEALADLIDAETEAQRRFALENADGRHQALYADWRDRILAARALIEAELDFADEDDVPGAMSDRVWPEMAALAEEIAAHVAGYRQAEIIRDGFKVAIIGAPNAGKSSLLNALAQRDVAIVSDEPGTTRDLVSVELDLDGMKVRVTDTAGIREAVGAVEREGIRRSRAAADEADCVIVLIDPGAPGAVPGAVPDDALRVASKIDLVEPGARAAVEADLRLSVRTGEGLVDLLDRLSAAARASVSRPGSLVPFTARQAEELTRGTIALRAAVDSTAGLEVQAEELRIASRAMGRVVGTMVVEEVLGAIFSRFCIGK
ncbi:MAG: tRNA uridine-5-carboxymethylaminomethyl(34) synthesis GTPase MnmE [Nitratireductor sp.]